MNNRITSLILIGCFISPAFAATGEQKSQPKHAKEEKVIKIERVKAVKRTKAELDIPLDLRSSSSPQRPSDAGTISDLSRP